MKFLVDVVVGIENYEMWWSLKICYLLMIVLGGFIGIGFLIVFGLVIVIVGFGGVLVVYVLMGIMVYFLMIFLGEMVIFLLIIGFFVIYFVDYVDLVFGFVMGWNYWFNWIIMIIVDVVFCGVVMNFWFFYLLLWIFLFVVFVLIVLINWLLVKFYGEIEYWFFFIKVVMIGFFLVVGFLVIFGIMGGYFVIGLKNFIYK